MNTCRTATYFVYLISLSACVWPTIYADHQPARGRVTDVWTEQQMEENWEGNVKSLRGAPGRGSYVRDYQVATVFVERLARNRHFEKLLVRRIENVAGGDIVDMEMGLRTRSPSAFADLGMITTIVCRHDDKSCLDDPARGKKLGAVPAEHLNN